MAKTLIIAVAAEISAMAKLEKKEGQEEYLTIVVALDATSEIPCCDRATLRHILDALGICVIKEIGF
ncbi:hypothetical protein HN51_011702 [Arachis hypogaea]